MGIVRCYWKLWWMPVGFEEPATGPPTGSMLDRPPDAVAWIRSTKPTPTPSKTSMSIRWSVMPADIYAAIPPCKQIRYLISNPDAEQAQHPPVDTQEMGMPDIACIPYRLSQAVYRPLFEQRWGAGSLT